MRNTPIIGIDKLVLTTTEFFCPTIPKMTPKFKAELHEHDEVLLHTRDGNTIRANSLYKDTSKLSVCSNVGINSRGLQVTLNPNKNYHTYRQNNDVELLKDTYKQVQKELKDIGIVTDIDHMRIARIDTAKDVEMSRPYEDYSPIYETMRGKYMKCTPYTTGIVVANKSRQVVWYDKAADILRLTGEVIPEKNYMRNEVRLMRGQTIRTNSYFDTANNLIRYFDHKDEMHHKQVKGVLTSLNFIEQEQGVIPYDDDILLLRDTFENNKRGQLLLFLASSGGIPTILKNYGSIEKFKVKVIDRLTLHRQQIVRLKSQLDEAYKTYLRQTDVLDKRHEDIISMITEMKQKFVA